MRPAGGGGGGKPGARLALVEAEAVDIRLSDDGAMVSLANGPAVDADIAVVALGNLPPHAPPAFAGIAHAAAYADDPWAAGLADGLERDDEVLLLGCGLTAVDCALSLDTAGFAGRIVAVSRRGLLPHAQAPGPAVASPASGRLAGIGAGAAGAGGRRCDRLARGGGRASALYPGYVARR